MGHFGLLLVRNSKNWKKERFLHLLTHQAELTIISFEIHRLYVTHTIEFSLLHIFDIFHTFSLYDHPTIDELLPVRVYSVIHF